MTPLVSQPVESSVETACPLDCPDSCTLTATIRDGRVVSLDGGHANPVTQGYICAKVRRFPERLYGDARLLQPLLRKGPKGSARFEPIEWDDALDRIAEAFDRVRREFTAEAILPFCYGGSNGLLTQDALDATFFWRLGASRLARTVCAAPTGAANLALYGKMPSVTYQDYVHAQLLVVVGHEPCSIWHSRDAVRARGAEARWQARIVDPRATALARHADLHLPVRPGTDVVVALAVHRYLFEHGKADQEFLARHTTGADRLRARAAEWDIARAADVAGLDPRALEQLLSGTRICRPR